MIVELNPGRLYLHASGKVTISIDGVLSGNFLKIIGFCIGLGMDNLTTFRADDQRIPVICEFTDMTKWNFLIRTFQPEWYLS
ncbi:MAG: hypothetical protein U5K51_17810 [Flavobacteriaceae bacterium]|nr:hypothetical protein [Flavobacteriaceae bacterium]